MTSDRTLRTSMSQTHDQRTGPLLPSYKSLRDGVNHTYEPSANPALTQLRSGPNVVNRRKSNAILSTEVLDEQHQVKGWPVEPRKLRDRTVLAFFFSTCEALVTLAPIAFISTSVQISAITLTNRFSIRYTGSQAGWKVYCWQWTWS